MISKDRFYHTFEVRTANKEYTVEGYAAVFDKETVLFEDNNIKYCEIINQGAFDGAKTDNIVMNYNHKGKPLARTKNDTLFLAIDKTGLKITADLSGTEEGRKTYEEIKGGYLDKMSFAFSVAKEKYDKQKHLRIIEKFSEIFDVAVVDRPAYETTIISARDYFKAEAERVKLESYAQKLKIKKQIIKELAK